MAHRTLYDHNGGVLRELIVHESDPEGEFHIRTAQDLEPVLDLAKSMREDNEVIGHRKSRNLVPVAEVPMLVVEKAMREGWFNDQKKWRQWINDPQNRPFRVTDGRF